MKVHLAFGLLFPAFILGIFGAWQFGVLYIGWILAWEAWKVSY